MRLQLTAVIAAVILVLSMDHVDATADEDDPWRLTTDTLLYSDTDNVVVISPQVAIHRELDEDGGNVSARVVVDVVSAASVDVVSQATNRFSEVRSEANLGLAKPVGVWLPSLRYRYSHEPDYLSHGFGASIEREIGSADTTLGVGYDLSLDTVGYRGTPRSVFSESLTSHLLAASLTQVLGVRSLIRGVYSLSVQNGYMEKPYRFVPLFDPASIAEAEADGVELGLDTFDAYRLPSRPSEEVPDQRIGHSMAVRGLRYLGGLPGSARLDYQFFFDNWGVRAHMVEPALAWKLTDRQTLTGYGRLYRQSAADFWRRQYVVEPGTVPHYRTLDRDLSNFTAVTGGLRYQWDISWLSAYGDASAMETLYSDYLFLDSRLALIFQIGLRWTP